ncbi:hypothetical protein H7I77_03105 [Mycolicibacterium novocastrense]|uniref:Uncharacterized protein n=1 Tax=Mycolicibacterium novocastrense TaxID=59813 RepID=A0AAW5SFE8_MYCNV|nr:hypothetical protein [Mycolicibacterium novocastrense]MCV7022340.1 hypothetical protein [Mycolicibacterium novocastrense]GAT09977.1 uncharacterized protein RMCN_3110 [Mycolicibacterium novocastrense]
MATRPFPDDVVSVDGASAADGPANHHRLTVLATDLADVIGAAGGWLFDRARAGWDVDVWVAHCADERPLTILGANTVGDTSEAVLRAVPRNGVLAVSAALLRDDPGVRARVFELAKRGAEVMAWGDDRPGALGDPVHMVEHQLSVAARAFKTHAVAAAGLTHSVGATETLFDLGIDSFRPLNPV